MFRKITIFNQDFYNLSTFYYRGHCKFYFNNCARLRGPLYLSMLLNIVAKATEHLRCLYHVIWVGVGVPPPLYPIYSGSLSLQFKLTKAFFLCDRYATAQIIIRL